MRHILKLSRLLPVIVIEDASSAVPLAQALLAGGIPVMEVTLRTPAALKAIEAIAQQVPEMTVGAGTIIRPAQFAEVQNAGAKFGVSPGLSPELLATAKQCGLPYLPGVATSSEIMQAVTAGFEVVKCFPAELIGGAKWISAQAAVFPQLKFCPSGGITLENVGSYLNLKSVLSAGSSWLAPSDRINNKDWQGITHLAQTTLATLVG